MGGVGSGPRKKIKGQLRDAIQNIDAEALFKKLGEFAEGHSVICPYCNKDTGTYTADGVVIEAIKELLNRRLGKPVQRQEIDVTSHIQLDADQINKLLKDRFSITIDDVRQYIEQRKMLS